MEEQGPQNKGEVIEKHIAESCKNEEAVENLDFLKVMLPGNKENADITENRHLWHIN